MLLRNHCEPLRRFCYSTDLSKLHSVVILTPVMNDWVAVGLLIEALDKELGRTTAVCSLVVVDDGSTRQPEPGWFRAPLKTLSRVTLIRLRRNLGHQRAIAIGLTAVYRTIQADAVVIMDADGEDRPGDVVRLIQACEEHDPPRIVFAARMRRTESAVFRFFYAFYRGLHRVLTGIPVRVGNFSIVPFPHLGSLVVVTELWNHYAAAVFKSRLPFHLIPSERGRRLAGASSMNFTALVTHGLSAISVFGEIAGVRLLIASGGLFALVCLLLAAVVTVRLYTPWAIPGWATAATGLLLLLAGQVLTASAGLVLFVLSSRNNLSFLPLRDYEYFIERTVEVYPLA
jgi:hypothetical protein